MSSEIESPVLNRWRAARRMTLGTILLAGSMATAAAAAHRLAHGPCARTHQQAVEVYSGIGVTIQQDGSEFIVTEVNPTGPSVDVLYPGAKLVSVNGETPTTLEGWGTRLRGEEGTTVEVEVEYSCGGEQTVTIEREVIRARRARARR